MLGLIGVLRAGKNEQVEFEQIEVRAFGFEKLHS